MKKCLFLTLILCLFIIIPVYAKDSTNSSDCLQEINLIKKDQCIEIQQSHAKISFAKPCSALNFYKNCSIKEKFITIEETKDHNNKNITMYYVYVIFEKENSGNNK